MQNPNSLILWLLSPVCYSMEFSSKKTQILLLSSTTWTTSCFCVKKYFNHPIYNEVKVQHPPNPTLHLCLVNYSKFFCQSLICWIKIFICIGPLYEIFTVESRAQDIFYCFLWRVQWLGNPVHLTSRNFGTFPSILTFLETWLSPKELFRLALKFWIN